MNIFLSHSIKSEYQKELYLPLKKSELIEQHQIFFPHDQEIVVNTREIIEKSDLVLAEVSISATGQGIELGWANSAGVPIICFYKEGIIPAGSIKFIASKLFSYKNSEDLISQISVSIQHKTT